MSWIQAVEILRQIVGRMRNNGDGTEWLERLEQIGCKDAHRLGFCIAIDVASGALTIEQYAELLDGLNLSETCSRRAFAKRVDAVEPDTIKCISHIVVSSEETDRYVQVIALGDFMTFFRKYHTYTPDDVQAVWTQHFSPYAPRDLAGIKEIWRGLTGVIWITSSEDFESLKFGRTGDELATVLNDALGLGKHSTSLTEEQIEEGLHDANELVGLLYPQSFSGARPPTAFDATWMGFGSYYVSGGDDGWGRTVSCSGTQVPMRERVHREYKESMEHFEGFPIGHIREQAANRSALLEMADRRLESILSSSPR